MNRKIFVTLLIALVIKLFLFIYAEFYSPGTKFQFDTLIYDANAKNMILHGEFARAYQDGKFSSEQLRTPGYPLFMGVLHYLFRVPFSGIIFTQILLTILVAFITYRAAVDINPKLGYFSFLIVIFDPPVTIVSLMLLTETLFLLLISLFMLTSVLYLKEKDIKFILPSALFVAMATYVRPVSYFLGIATAIFLLYLFMRTRIKKILIHALIFLVVVYGFIGLWHFRNHRVNGNNKFSTVTELAPSYREDIIEKDAIKGVLPPALYYLNVFSRSIISLMTDPGSLKDLNSHILKRIGKVIAYPWVVFWLIGFIVGVSRIKKNDIHLQFLLLVVLYFTAASIGGFLFGVSSRARIPMVPFIAILSAYGWSRLTQTKEKGCKR